MTRRRKVLLAGAAVVVVAAGAVTAVLLLTGPSYSHPWCAPVIAELDNGHQSIDRQLRRLQPYHRVPLMQKYTNDTIAFQVAYATEQADLNQVVSPQSLADLEAAKRAGNRWKADQDKIRAACRS